MNLFLNRIWSLLPEKLQLAIKFGVVTVLLGLVGKAMFVGAVQGGGINPAIAQFVPTLPMMGLTFLAHRYIWDHREVSLRSHVGIHWSKSYAQQFAAGHGTFFILYSLLGYQYLRVSLGIGAASAVATFTRNEWRIFARRKAETKTVTA